MDLPVPDRASLPAGPDAPARLIYLHGFRSSPQSFKARMLGQALAARGLADRFVCPALPPSPAQAIAQIETGIGCRPRDLLVGSSLGGYYARYLAERHGCRAVLLNPAIHPDRDLERYLGVQTLYHDPSQRFEVRREHLQELIALRVVHITQPGRYLLVAATGDELIDWRDMVAAYPGAQHRIVPGSDHALSDFASLIEEVLGFAGWIPRA